MSLPPLIGLVGGANAGKSTVAGHLTYAHHWTHIAFADALREMLFPLLAAAGLPEAFMIERDLKEQPMPVIGVSYRRLAQTLGTEWGRQLIDQDLWTRIAMRQVLEARRDHGEAVVISDCRFENEAKAIREAGGVLVRVDRPEPSGLLGGTSRHISETWSHVADTEHILWNHGSLATLNEQVDRLVDTLTRPAAAPAGA